MIEKKQAKILIAAVSSIFLILLVVLGLQNRRDPFWDEIDAFVKSPNIVLIQDRKEDLEKAFQSIQRDYTEKRQSALDLISKPFLPSWQYDTFISVFKKLAKNRILIISGVTGAGKTTLATRLARLVSASARREMNISCVPKFEIEYHKQYIGYQTGSGFIKGSLLTFFEQCFSDPLHNYVLIIDDIDKMNPESFFGAALWGELDNPGYDHPIEHYTNDIIIPPNFYMISITHSGVGSAVEFNDEHYRRLGNVHFVSPDYVEFYLYLREKSQKEKIDEHHIKKLLYSFARCNRYIEKKYSRGHTLGQWSTLKKYYKPGDFGKFIQCFIEHVNAFKPEPPMKAEDLNDIFYAIETGGYLQGTNLFAQARDFMLQYGLLSEFSVALLFVVVSAGFGWIIFLRRRRYSKSITDRVYTAVDRYNKGTTTYENVQIEITELKKEIDNLIYHRKLSYDEATFFYFLIDDSFKSIDSIKKTHDLSEEFMHMLNDFLSDGVIDEREYHALNRFLDKLRLQISDEDYHNLKDRVDEYYRNSPAHGGG